MVRHHMDVQGIINAFKDGKIGGDVHFISQNGISIGKTGIINVGRLTLGTNPAPYVDTIHSVLLKNSEFSYYPVMTQWTTPVEGEENSSIMVKGQINTIGDVAITNDEDITVDGGKIRTNRDFTGVMDTLSTDALRSKLVNLPESTAVTATDLGDGSILIETGDTLSMRGRRRIRQPFSLLVEKLI